MDDPLAPAIKLPADHYAHVEATTEWWWHIGTLRTPGRTFGFEVNATKVAFAGQPAGFSQIMITDVAGQKHFQNSVVSPFPLSQDWAESNPSNPWYVKMGSIGDNGAILMQAPADDIESMKIEATCLDADTSTPINIKLHLRQEGLPLLVLGTGVKLDVDPSQSNPLKRNNYYYSFTRLQATGTLKIGPETFEVTGTTWMDHEYGAFPPSFRWVLQDAQLDNHVQLSSFTVKTDFAPSAGVPIPGFTSILWPDGKSTVEDSITTPLGPTWVSPFSQVTYFMKFKVEIRTLNTTLVYTSSVPSQEFGKGGTGAHPVYEGIGEVEGEFDGRAVSGTAWIEQDLNKNMLGGGRAGLVAVG